MIVLAEAYNAWDDQPAIGNARAACAEMMDTYRKLEPWFGIEQELGGTETRLSIFEVVFWDGVF